MLLFCHQSCKDQIENMTLTSYKRKKENMDKRNQNPSFSPILWLTQSCSVIFNTVGNTATSPYTLKTHSQGKPKNTNTCRYYWHELNICVHILAPLSKHGCTNYMDEGTFCTMYVCVTPANTQHASCTIQSPHHSYAHTNVANPHTCNFGSTE